MSEDSLLEVAQRAVESYFLGENKTRRSVRFDMEDLRAAVNAELKRKSQAETARIEKK